MLRHPNVIRFLGVYSKYDAATSDGYGDDGRQFDLICGET